MSDFIQIFGKLVNLDQVLTIEPQGGAVKVVYLDGNMEIMPAPLNFDWGLSWDERPQTRPYFKAQDENPRHS